MQRENKFKFRQEVYDIRKSAKELKLKEMHDTIEYSARDEKTTPRGHQYIIRSSNKRRENHVSKSMLNLKRPSEMPSIIMKSPTMAQFNY